MTYKTLLIAATAAVFVLSGCGNDKSTDLQNSLSGNTVEAKIAGFAVFDPTSGTIPYPNNILFAPNDSSTNDFDGGKTLNIPYEPTDPDANIKRQLNALTGFSTTSPISAPLSEGTTLDPASFVSGVQVYKVNVDPATGAVTDINATLRFGVDFVAAQQGDRVVIVPLKPLDGLTNYMVVLNNGLKDAKGRILSPDYVTALTLSSHPVQPGGSIDEESAQKLEAIRQANRAMLGAMLRAGIDPTGTVQIWTFRTQMIGAVEARLAAAAAANPTAVLGLQRAGLTTKQLFMKLGLPVGAYMKNSADIYVGTLANLPQYMPQASKENPLPVLKGEFEYVAPFTPKVEANVTIPVVATLPSTDSNCTMPDDGWPVVIYQHGITRVRTDLFVYGETLAAQCYAGIAIDLPLHGITESNTTKNPFYMGTLERTFNVDLVTEDAAGNIVAFEPDGKIDSSGANFMNLANVTTTRDNLYQTTSDLIELAHAVGSAQGVKLDGSKIAFLAHSLGNIASIGFLSHTNSLQTAVLMMPGQQVIPFLTHSPVFAPAINAGLAAFGIMEGTPEYNAFMLASQTILDDADPANYTPELGKNPLKILEISAVGDGTEGSGDQHIPFSVQGYPLAGGKPFVHFTNAKEINTSAIVETPGGYFYFLAPDMNHTASLLTEGEHRSPLSPQFGLTPFTEIHNELISFIKSEGRAIKIHDPSIIKH